MLLSGTALAASDPAGVDTTDMPPELKGRETIVVKGQRHGPVVKKSNFYI
jgi:iron complex outermembrane receptor protein